jgi:DNA-binding NarL/FixJ family response regulator
MTTSPANAQPLNRPRIMIAEDHTLVAEALRTLLEPEYQVVSLVEDGRSLLAAAQELKPYIILLDLGMPMLNGFDAGQLLRKALPAMNLIVLAMNEDSEIASTRSRIQSSSLCRHTR